jgi:hypothetical protein
MIYSFLLCESKLMKFDLGLLVFGSYYSVLKLGFLDVDDETGYRFASM